MARAANRGVIGDVLAAILERRGGAAVNPATRTALGTMLLAAIEDNFPPERGLLREEDPIKLQRAVTEIAYSYARGGSTATGYVPGDSPLGPSRPLPEAMGWPDLTLREQYDDSARTADGSTLRQQSATNEAEIRTRQTRQRAVLGRLQPVQPLARRRSERKGAALGEAVQAARKAHEFVRRDADGTEQVRGDREPIVGRGSDGSAHLR